MKTKALHLELPEEMGDQLGRLAEQKQTSPEVLALEALRLYLSLEASDLAEEIAAWDKLSDEALSAFESELR